MLSSITYRCLQRVVVGGTGAPARATLHTGRIKMSPVTSIHKVLSHTASGKFVAGIGTFKDLILRAGAGAGTNLLYDASVAKITFCKRDKIVLRKNKY